MTRQITGYKFHLRTLEYCVVFWALLIATTTTLSTVGAFLFKNNWGGLGIGSSARTTVTSIILLGLLLIHTRSIEKNDPAAKLIPARRYLIRVVQVIAWLWVSLHTIAIINVIFLDRNVQGRLIPFWKSAEHILFWLVTITIFGGLLIVIEAILNRENKK